MANQHTPSRTDIERQLFGSPPDEAQITEFYAALGRAIAAWQLVEMALYELYEAAIVPRRPGAAAAAFHERQQFSSKLEATNMAVRFALLDSPAALTKTWARLRKLANDKADHRNRFAHFQVREMFDERRRENKIVLQPQMFDVRYYAGLKKKSVYRLNEIRAATRTFARVARCLSEFRPSIPPHRTRPKTSA